MQQHFLIRDGIYYDQDTDALVTGLIQPFHDSGQLSRRGNLKDGKRIDLCEVFDSKGRIVVRRHYENGVVEPFCESFYPNGQLESRLPFKDGELID